MFSTDFRSKPIDERDRLAIIEMEQAAMNHFQYRGKPASDPMGENGRENGLERRRRPAIFAPPTPFKNSVSSKEHCLAVLFSSTLALPPRPASPHFSPGGEAKCIRGLSVRGARRRDRQSCLSIVATRRRPIVPSKRNEVMAGLSCAWPVSR